MEERGTGQLSSRKNCSTLKKMRQHQVEKLDGERQIPDGGTYERYRHADE